MASQAMLSASTLARRVHPQLAAHFDRSGSSATEGCGQSGDSTEPTPPFDDELAATAASAGDDSWPPSGPSSPPPLPVTLRLCASGVGGGSMGAVLAFLRGRSDVNQLDLRANGLTDESLVPLLAAMAGPLSTIRALDLSGVTGFAANRMGLRTAEALTRLLASPDCRLSTLRLAAMGRTSLSVCVLQQRCLAGSSSLTSLDLSGNALTNPLMRALCSQLSGPRCALRRLNLSRNELSDACCESLAALLRSSSRLSELSLADNELTGRGMHTLADALEADTCALSALVLDDNRLLGDRPSEADESNAARGSHGAAVGVDRLFRSLSANSSLQRLSLCGCSIAGVDELASSLAVNSTLTALLLDRNPTMRSAGCAQLLHSLAHNCTLLQLSLAHNRLDDTIAPPLARLMQANPYLQSLSLADNGLTDEFIHAVLPTVYLNPHCAVSRLELDSNHLQGKHTERLRTVMQRNARVQRRRLLTHYQHTISRLHALPGQLREAAGDIERLQRECECERLKEASTAQRVQAERAAMEADTVRMRAQLDAMREERRQQTARQSAALAALSSRLAAERSELKSAAASLRQEVVNEKKIQAQLHKQIGRATAVWDSLEEIRRSGDIVERSLQQQLAQLHSDANVADESCGGWATKLQHAATAVVNRYWIALNTYTHSKRFADRNHSAHSTHRANAQPASLALSASQQQQQHQRPASASSLPSGVLSSLSDWSSGLQSSGALLFVPPLPPAGAAYDVDMADFLSWFYSTSTPSATIALIPAAVAKRMPIVAFAQAKCQTQPGRHIQLFVQPAVTTHQHIAQHSQASNTAAQQWPSRRSHVSLLGLLSLTAGSAGVAQSSPPLSSIVPTLFSGCTLVVHPADTHSSIDTGRRDRQRSMDAVSATTQPVHPAADSVGGAEIVAVAAGVGMSSTRPSLAVTLNASFIAASSHPHSHSQQHSSTGLSSTLSSATGASVLQLSIDSGSSWPAVLQAVSSLLSLDCSSPGSSVQLSCLPGIRLCEPTSRYLELAADTPRLTLEEAMSELGGLNAITAAAAHRKQMLAVDGQAAVGEVTDTALPTLSDDLNQLLADIGADLMLSARSRPPPAQTALPHFSNTRRNRRADSMQHSNKSGTAAPNSHRAGGSDGSSELDGDAFDSGSDTQPQPHGSKVSAATGIRPSSTSGAAATTAAGGSRSQSHSLHRISLVQQQRQRAALTAARSATAGNTVDSEQLQQRPQQQAAIEAAGLVADNGDDYRWHARRSSTQLIPNATTHSGHNSSGGSRTSSRALLARTGSTKQLHTITATLAAGAAREHKELQRVSFSKVRVARSTERTQPLQRTRGEDSILKRGSQRFTRGRSTPTAEEHDPEEGSTDDDEQPSSAGGEAEERWVPDDSLQSTERPLAPSASSASVDVFSVARQPPARWWSGTRVAAAAPHSTASSAPRPLLRAADFSLGQSDALLPFAPSGAHAANQPPDAHFAHLALNSRQADFAADLQYAQPAAAGDTPQQPAGQTLGVESGMLAQSGSATRIEQRAPTHWQLMRRSMAPIGLASNDSFGLAASPALSAACRTAIRPWPALCSETMVN